MATKRAGQMQKAKGRPKNKKLSDEDWAALEKRTVRLGPKTGLGILQEQGGHGVNRAARSAFSKAPRKPG